MPHHADAPVARLATRFASRFITSTLADASRTGQLGRTQCLRHRHLDRVELVVASHLLGDTAAVVLEHDEVAQEVEKAPRRAEALDRHLELRQARVG